MNCMVQSYTALDCTDLHCFFMKCSVLHSTSQNCAALHCPALHCTAQCKFFFKHLHFLCNVFANFFIVQCSAVQCRAVQCSAGQCSAVQCSAVLFFDIFWAKMEFFSFSATTPPCQESKCLPYARFEKQTKKLNFR